MESTDGCLTLTQNGPGQSLILAMSTTTTLYMEAQAEEADKLACVWQKIAHITTGMISMIPHNKNQSEWFDLTLETGMHALSKEEISLFRKSYKLHSMDLESKGLFIIKTHGKWQIQATKLFAVPGILLKRVEHRNVSRQWVDRVWEENKHLTEMCTALASTICAAASKSRTETRIGLTKFLKRKAIEEIAPEFLPKMDAEPVSILHGDIVDHLKMVMELTGEGKGTRHQATRLFRDHISAGWGARLRDLRTNKQIGQKARLINLLWSHTGL